MDGTIYQLDGDGKSFGSSSLDKNVKANAINFFANQEQITTEQATELYDNLVKSKIWPSVYAAEKYSISRTDFFNIVWDINPNSIVINYEDAVKVIKELSQNGVELILLTQAPKIWQNKVFIMLGINDLFSEIYTAENYIHKPEIYSEIKSKRDPQTILAIGDQLETDIVPAIEQGFHTFHVTSPNDLLQLIQDEQ